MSGKSRKLRLTSGKSLNSSYAKPSSNYKYPVSRRSRVNRKTRSTRSARFARFARKPRPVARDTRNIRYVLEPAKMFNPVKVPNTPYVMNQLA
jgi:hypothetical protein